MAEEREEERKGEIEIESERERGWGGGAILSFYLWQPLCYMNIVVSWLFGL